MTDNSSATDFSGPWRIGPAIAGWALPGLGHILAGEKRRGAIIMITILSLYLAGLLIGGIDVVDRKEDHLWFAAQMFAGPVTMIVDTVHQKLKDNVTKALKLMGDGPIDSSKLAYTASIGRVNELGTLYCALAGLLNLLALVDVVYRIDRREPDGELTEPIGQVVKRESVT